MEKKLACFIRDRGKIVISSDYTGNLFFDPKLSQMEVYRLFFKIIFQEWKTVAWIVFTKFLHNFFFFS